MYNLHNGFSHQKKDVSVIGNFFFSRSITNIIMNFNRLSYDTCTYQHDLKQSIGVSEYILGMPRVNCDACFPADPLSGTLGYAAGVQPFHSVVDTDSELMGITRRATNCPTSKYIPDFKNQDFSLPGVPIPDCRALPNEVTRMSNPPATLREHGWNRWEVLHENPQDRAEVPFRFNVNNRILFKDNHRPCIPEPINQAPSLPPFNQHDDVIQYNVKQEHCGAVYDSISNVQFWDTCSKLDKMI